MRIYIIEEAHLDYLENRSSEALYFKIFGFFTEEDQAKKFCKEGGRYTKEDCWAVPEQGIDKYRYKEISKL